MVVMSGECQVPWAGRLYGLLVLLQIHIVLGSVGFDLVFGLDSLHFVLGLIGSGRLLG